MKKALLSLAILAFSLSASAQTTCTELFFSEYVEGSGNSKALEVYNPTGAAVNLSNYRIVRYSNGATTGFDSLNLAGTLASHDVWVVSNGQTTTSTTSPACDPALQALSDQLGVIYPDPLYFNGDDAIVLVRISPYAIIDIFGKIGEDPGTSWTDVFPFTDAAGAYWTKDKTLQRKSTVTSGTTINPLAFDATQQYDSLPENTWTGLGQHDCLCNTVGVNEAAVLNGGLKVFPNPTNGVLQFTAVQNLARITVYNVIGQTVIDNTYEVADQRNAQTINLATQPAGVYLVQVELANGQRVTKKINVR
jgi:hypothetical protein